MQYRLRRHEKEAIRRLYRDNTIYKAFAAPCKKYGAQPKDFKLSPEELFFELTAVLDDIKEAPEDARFALQEFWSEKVVDYEELSSSLERSSIEQAASMVTLSVVICLDGMELSLYNTLGMILAGQLRWDSPQMVEMKESFMSNIYRLGEDDFSAAIAEYMNSDVFVSEDIAGLLEDLPQSDHAESDTDGDDEGMPRLTNRQLMILFDLFLNKGFSTEYCNQKALAILLSRVSGRSEESIRQKIRCGVDYEIADVHNDVKLLAQLLEPIDSSLAEKMRNLIE